MLNNKLRICGWMIFIVVVFGNSSVYGKKTLPEQSVGYKLKVIKKKDMVFIRSKFSKNKDMVLVMNRGANKEIRWQFAFLLPKEYKGKLTFNNLKRNGTFIHSPGGETPWRINGTCIGASHGCAQCRTIIHPGHNLTTADLGSVWKDEKGNGFYVIRILDYDRFWVFSENKGNEAVWKFNTLVSGNTLKKADDKERILKDIKVGATQLLPCLRINKQEYLVNGKTPLKDEEIVECDFLDIVDDHDIINPGSVLEAVIKNPGMETDFISDKLNAVLRNQITFRILPGIKIVLYYKARALQEFNADCMMFVMARPLLQGKYDSLEYYIPKTKAFSIGDRTYDFKSIQDFSGHIDTMHFKTSENNIENPKNLPDRFIQFLGDKGKREVGMVLGYSLINGDSVPEKRAQVTDDACFIYKSKKSYPNGLDRKIGKVPAGKEFNYVCHKQYFDPSTFKNPTCVYWHKEGDNTVVYIDYHKSVKNDKIKLPKKLTGRKITVVEKTPSLTLNTSEVVPEDGLKISVDKYGYVVLKIE